MNQTESIKTIRTINIHKQDFSDKELNPAAYLDILLSDLQEQIKEIANAVNEKDDRKRDIRISMMGEYLRGVRDGNRFRPSPFKELNN